MYLIFELNVQFRILVFNFLCPSKTKFYKKLISRVLFANKNVHMSVNHKMKAFVCI